MDEQELIQSEKLGAISALTYLTEDRLAEASKFKDNGAFKMTFTLTFQRGAGPTFIKAKVRYTKSMGEDVELYCLDNQLELEYQRPSG